LGEVMGFMADYPRVQAEHRNGLQVLRVLGELDSIAASAFAERASQSIRDTHGPVRVDLSGLTVIDELGGLALATILEAIAPERLVSVDFVQPQVHQVLQTLGLHLESMPGRDGTGPEYETPKLVNRVREARLHAGEARLEASRILVLVSKTTVRVTSTRQRTARAREQRRRLVDGGRVGRERDIRPRAVPITFPDNAPADPVVKDRLDSSSATLRRAVAFIDEHADRHLTVADIAAASYVTIRAVQLAFRRHLGMTPMEYLRRVRLDRAHQDLVAADPARESVTAVAYRWGFASASRFTAYYRGAYGVLPSRTLRS
jgi:AraC-like DNA-binding protein/anti-anti-sigma regulatory factor